MQQLPVKHNNQAISLAVHTRLERRNLIVFFYPFYSLRGIAAR